MAAIGWYVGLVHYPAFRLISREHWRTFHSMHSTFTGVLVLIPMLAQVALTFLVAQQTSLPFPAKAVLVVLMIFSVGWTFLISGPLHQKMADQDEKAINLLIWTNTPRAVAWTLQALFCGILLNAVQTLPG
ncbi:MAG: hypothetical protein KDC26_11540 [Armatimonadetes bacterium]|nr:hypothetical protein [Armatimonadota bacterium]